MTRLKRAGHSKPDRPEPGRLEGVGAHSPSLQEPENSSTSRQEPTALAINSAHRLLRPTRAPPDRGLARRPAVSIEPAPGPSAYECRGPGPPSASAQPGTRAYAQNRAAVVPWSQEMQNPALRPAPKVSRSARTRLQRKPALAQLVLRLRHKIHPPLEVFSANVRGSGRLR